MEDTADNAEMPVRLLTLPPEIQSAIYTHLFHENQDQQCNVHLDKPRDTGCWCSDGLTLTNCRLYAEFRSRFYEHIRLVFASPKLGALFLRRLGHQREWITSLKITFANTAMGSYLLEDIFNRLSNSRLRNLELKVVPFTGDVRTDPRSRPLYLPSSLETTEFAANQYDLQWRPLKFSLGRMNGIASLVIVGYPNVEVEEAIFVLSMSMGERARLEGNRIEKRETRDSGLRGDDSEWFYKIQILTEKKFPLAL